MQLKDSVADRKNYSRSCANKLGEVAGKEFTASCQALRRRRLQQSYWVETSAACCCQMTKETSVGTGRKTSQLCVV